MSAPLLAAEGLVVSVAGRALVERLDLRLDAGEHLAILGRNGAGKTTLLHTLAGLRRPDAGVIRLCGSPYAALDPRRAAQLRGLLPQHQLDAFPASVLDTALIGRHPHLGRWAWESAADERVARDALAQVGLAGLEAREVQTLSGGERQRLALATLLTQSPRLYLLDEPLSHLDLAHQIGTLELLAGRLRGGDIGAVTVMHDVNLALRFCDRALLLFGDGAFLEGPADSVLRSAHLSRLYGHPLRELGEGGSRHFLPA